MYPCITVNPKPFVIVLPTVLHQKNKSARGKHAPLYISQHLLAGRFWNAFSTFRFCVPNSTCLDSPVTLHLPSLTFLLSPCFFPSVFFIFFKLKANRSWGILKTIKHTLKAQKLVFNYHTSFVFKTRSFTKSGLCDRTLSKHA